MQTKSIPLPQLRNRSHPSVRPWCDRSPSVRPHKTFALSPFPQRNPLLWPLCFVRQRSFQPQAVGLSAESSSPVLALVPKRKPDKKQRRRGPTSDFVRTSSQLPPARQYISQLKES